MNMEVSILELLLHYIQLSPSTPLSEAWGSLLQLFREGSSLSPPSQFILLAILSQFVHKTNSPLPDKRDQKDLQDITAKVHYITKMVHYFTSKVHYFTLGTSPLIYINLH